MDIKNFKIKVLIILVTFTLLAFIILNFFNKPYSLLPNIKLGLDLKGGTSFLLGVDFDDYLSSIMEDIADRIKENFRKEKIYYRNLNVKNRNIEFRIKSEMDFLLVKKIVGSLDDNIVISNNANNFLISYKKSHFQKIFNEVINKSIDIIRSRIDIMGVKEPVIFKEGDNNILVQIPEEIDTSRLRDVIKSVAKITFHIVSDDIKNNNPAELLQNFKLIKESNSQDKNTAIDKKPLINGESIEKVQVVLDYNSHPVIAFTLNNYATKIFAEATKQNLGKRIAIILDGKVLCAPVVSDHILNGSGIISGDFSMESATELAYLIQSGALPARIKILEERSIGPNLGLDSINYGRKASLISFCSILIFMTWSYGVSGVFASIALIFNIIYILTILSIMQATLTLAGIAGIILTMGMAVDANILIFERIKEELKLGVSKAYAIKNGFGLSFTAIIDSNATTLIIAIILYLFGVNNIRGFAITLAIGIISSMFSSIIITRFFLELWLKYFKPRVLYL